MHPLIFAYAALVSALFWCGSTQADERASDSSLAAMARAARGSFREPSADQWREQLAALRAATNSLDRYLVDQGANGEAWRKYLLWEVLTRELKSAQPSIREWVQVNGRFSSGERGLEMPIFADVQHALARLLPTARLLEQPDVRKQYAAKLDELARLLKDPAQRSAADVQSPGDRREHIGQILGWLEEYGQAADLVAKARRQLSHANLLVRISRPLLATEVDKPIDQTGQVSQKVLGSLYSGTARTVGRTELKFIPEAQRAVLEIRLTGQSDANTSAQVGGGRGTVYSQTVTAFEANKRLVLDSSGIELKPSEAQARITSGKSSVAASGIGRRAIRRRAGEARPQAEAESARTSERELGKQLDGMVSKMLHDVADLPPEGGKPAAWRRPYFPQLNFSTTADQLDVAGLEADSFQLGADGQPPQAAPAADLDLCLHESWLNNRGHNLLAGKRLDAKTLPAALSDWLGWPLTPPSDGKQGPAADEPPWTVALADHDPLGVSLQHGTCEIVVGFESFTSGTSTYPAMQVRAKYRVDAAGKAARLVLADKLEVYPPGFVPHSGQRLGGRYQTYRRLLEKRIKPIFPTEIPLDRLRLDQPFSATGELRGMGLSISDGWLSVGFKRAG